MVLKKIFNRKKLTKKQKEQVRIKLRLYYGMEIGFILGIIFILMFLSVRTPFSTTKFLSNKFSNGLYDAVVVTNIDNNVTTRISELCGRFPDAINQVDCVMTEINFLYNYTFSHSDGKVLNSPDEYAEKGGVCRDIVVLQKAIFLKMGYNAYYRHPIPNHITLSISKKVICSTHPTLGDNYCWLYCDIDGKYYECN